NALIKLGDYEGAMKAFQSVDDYNHALGRQREALGYIFLKDENCERAILEFRRAVDVSPFSISAQIGLGLSKLRCGYLVGALEAFSKVLVEHPNNEKALTNRAIVYIQLGEHEKGKLDLKTILDNNPEHIEARINMSIVLNEMGDRIESKAVLEILHSEYPDNVTILNNLALVYVLEGEILSAMDIWETSLDIDPRQDHIRQNLRQLRFDRNLFRNTNDHRLTH
ncbi:hypothetical protein K8T06_15370, partial [bacterium]|nr:hypothetical protein [bacterium]